MAFIQLLGYASSKIVTAFLEKLMSDFPQKFYASDTE